MIVNMCCRSFKCINLHDYTFTSCKHPFQLPYFDICLIHISKKLRTLQRLIHCSESNRLRNEVLIDTILGTFPTETRVLDSAKWRDNITDKPGIDTHHTHLQRLRNPIAPLHVPAVEVAREAHVRGIGQLNDLPLRAEREQRGHGPEGLLGGDLHVAGHVAQDGRLEEVGAEVGEALAAGEDARAAGHRVAHVALHLGHRPPVDQRAVGHARVEAAAHLEGVHARRELRRECVVDPRLHEDAVRAHAGLPRGAELRGDGAGHGRVEVRVVEHDERRVAAQLEGQLFERVRRLLHQQLADARAAGEGNFAHCLGRCYGFSDFSRVVESGDDIDNSFWYTSSIREFGQGGGSQWCLAW